MFRKFNFFLLILLLSPIFCLTNTFADENGEPDEGFKFPVSKGPTNIPGLPEAQIAPERIIGSPDFEKMRDLPTDSQDYQLGRKVGQLRIPVRNEPGRYWICTGFLVGPDLFMTNHHCVHDGSRLRLLDRATIYMDYYQERAVDPTYGGITARVSAIVEMDEDKDYALLRLDRPIGNTYGWLELDTTIDPDDTSQSVKIISHPQGRSKEIVRRNSQIIRLTPDSRAQYPYLLAYLADTERGSSGSPVFLRDGTGVIAIHHSGLSNRNTGMPIVNLGSLMSHIAPEIQQYLPGVVVPAPPSTPTPPDPAPVATTLEVVSGSGQNARVNQPLANPLVVRVKDQNDAVMSGVSVSFTVAPGGTVNPSSATTGSNGEAETRLTLGGTAGTYTVTARASGITQPVTFTATATAAPQEPDPLAFSPSTIADQTFTVGSTIQSLRLPVATGGTAPYTYSLSPIPAGLSFSSATRILSGTPTTAATATSIIYTARDAAGRSASLTFTITVRAKPIFTPSVIADQTFTVGEPVILTLPVASGGTPPYAYTLAPLPEGLSFNSDGRILSGTPTTAGTITATYTATDTANMSASLTFTIEITENNPPVFTEGASTTRTIAENTVVGTNIGSAVSATDADDDTLTYTLSGTDAAAFGIVSTTGQLRTLAALDYETKSIYTVSITVSDGSLTDTISVTINVTDIDEEPVFAEGASTTRTIAENTIVGTNIGSAVSATDADDDMLTYTLSGTDAAAFSIVSTTGQLRTQAALDAAIKSVYSVTVTVSDGVHTVPISVIINVTDAEMPPVLDVNSDGVVDIFDLVLVAANFGATVDPTTPNPADVNDDGVVNLTDLLLVIGGMESTAGVAAAPVLSEANLHHWIAEAKRQALGDATFAKGVAVLEQLLDAVRPTPKETLLLSNYPNPFNPETWIPYHLATDAEVVLTIYNVRGVAVRKLTLGHQPAGVYESRGRAAYWDGRNAVGEPVASGLYFYTLTAGDFTATRKMLIAK